MLKEFSEANTILVDKPLEWTSFDVVNKLRWHLKRKLGVKKIKVGHAGTLDPLATGLLILCIGKNTKKIESYMDGVKTYTGTILLGKTTPSFDLETEYDSETSTDAISKDDVYNAANLFLGESDQMPPVFSAKKVDGKRAYESARKGEKVDLKTKRITIDQFDVDCSRFPEIDFVITCSKGTYIRSIANDIGQKLNVGGTLIALRRVKSGQFSIDNAKSVDDWIEFIENTPL